MLALIILVGLQFSIRLKFFQIFKAKVWLKKTIGTVFSRTNTKNKGNGISPFQAASTALAGAIGTGNIIGVATAITLGGPGSVFWMWVAAIFGMMTVFAENILGVKYRVQSSDGQNMGGPMYYIEKGLNQKWLAILFSVNCILASFGMGNMAQANAISAAFKKTFSISPSITGLVLAVLAGIIILGGIKRIAKVSEKIVPFMALFYILGGVIIIILHINNIPKALFNIVYQAFNLKSIFGGTLGYSMTTAIKYGISRGVFSNEAGLGSSPIVHAASHENEPTIQGMWGIFQVFIDTIDVCTITALCILTTNLSSTEKDGALLSIEAFSSSFGSFGELFVLSSIVLFSFATIISWSYYGERSVEYISSKKYILIYRAIYIVFILFGSVLELGLVWSLSDTFNGLMAIPNLIALIFLSNQVIKEYKAYNIKNNYS